MTTLLEPPAAGVTLRSLALDVTRACQANCDHCYNHSGPGGDAGEMTRENWLSVLDQAAMMGVQRVQFIGGEPTLHPHLPELVTHALDLGLQVEVFSNLIHIRTSMWPVLRQRGVTLATSYYSDSPEEHEKITHHRGSYARTKAHIEQAVRYRIPVRAAIVHVLDGQRVEEATSELRRLGVTSIRVDRLREIGRGAGGRDRHDVNELCGHCADGRAAVMPSGQVAGCVMSGGMMTAGDVRTTPLASIVAGAEWERIAAAIPRPRTSREGCTPDEDSCMPSPGADDQADAPVMADGCNPDQDSSDCAPAETEACDPKY